MQEDLSFGQLVKQLRAKLDITQESLAERVGCAVQSVRSFENGRRRPSRQMALRLAEILAVPASEHETFLQLARVAGSPGSVLSFQDSAVARSHTTAVVFTPRPLPEPVELIGREREHADLVARLRDGRPRLVTLVGPGGVGKTCLALQVAADLAADHYFADGVAVALLASVADASGVAPAIAEALGLVLQGARPAIEQLAAALQGRALLLMLDNLEHFLIPAEAPALIGLLLRLLEAAPNLHLLVTSRERLNLSEEQVVPLTGLATPSTTGASEQSTDAIELFLSRAQRVQPGFVLTRDNRGAVAHICRRLDGLPLALELAAAWVRALAPAELAKELEQSLDVLSGAGRDIPERHRSMRAALEPSWRLLEDKEKASLARLSVFRGGCERGAAETVTGAILPVLAALVDKSLLRRTTDDGSPRYVLHELVRQYAAERLADDPRAHAEAEQRHTEMYLDLLQRSINRRTSGSTAEGRTALSRESDNLRAVWVRAVHRRDTTVIAAMARPFAFLYNTRGWLREGADLFGQAIQALESLADATAICAALRSYQGYFLLWSGCAGEAAVVLDLARAELEAAGVTEGMAYIRLHLGSVALFRGRWDEARDHYAAALSLALPDDPYTYQWAMLFQGYVALCRGEMVAAETSFHRTLEAWRAHGFYRGVGSVLFGLSESTRHQGRLEEASVYARECLQIGSIAPDRWTTARGLHALGGLALVRGQYTEAVYLLSESIEIYRDLGDRWSTGRSRALLVQAHLFCGNLEDAWQGCWELLTIGREEHQTMLAELAYGLALVRTAEGHHDEAAMLLTALKVLPAEDVTLRQSQALIKRLAIDGVARPDRLPGTPAEIASWLEAHLVRRPRTRAEDHTPVASVSRPLRKGELSLPDNGSVLSPREVEVLRLLVGGASNASIASTLVISLFTVKTHVASILSKLGVASRTEAALRGRDLGLTALPTRESAQL